MDSALFLLYDEPPKDTKKGRVITNYYPISCTESKRTKTVKYNYQGRVNDPNVVYHPPRGGAHHKLVLSYQAVELCLCPMYESFFEFPFLNHANVTSVHGAIVITHRPLVNGPVLYSCFFLTNDVHAAPNSSPLERLFHFRDSMKEPYQSKPFYLSMDEYVGEGVQPRILETEHHGQPCMVLLYPEPIAIRFPTMTLVGGASSPLLLTGGVQGVREGFGGRMVEGASALSNTIALDANGNPHGYGLKFGGNQCPSTAPGQTTPDLSNLPTVSTTYQGDPVKQNSNATVSSDGRCRVFDTAVQSMISNRDSLNQLIAGIFDYRQNNDGLNPYLGDNNQDCYQAYVDNFWGGEQNFLNYLIQQKVSLPPHYNYWNPYMVNNGYDPASIYYNLNGQCYDANTVKFNTGRAEAAGYSTIGVYAGKTVSDASYAINSAVSVFSKAGNVVLNAVTGNSQGCEATQGPSMVLTVPILDSPDVTYQECTMVSSDESELMPVYLNSDAQYYVQSNSLIGMVFYFILFLIIYFGVPFAYFFVMCTLLKQGFNYSGTATFAEYLRKPQNFLGLGKNRGISILFNAIYWFIVLVVWSATLIPGADTVQLNSVVILMVIAWIIGYIGVKNNPPPESCFY